MPNLPFRCPEIFDRRERGRHGKGDDNVPLRDLRRGFDFCVDHRRDHLPGHWAAACPKGIGIYFTNVGDAVSEAELLLLNVSARVPLCGLVALYNSTASPQGPDGLGTLVGALLQKRIKTQGFIVHDDCDPRFKEFAGAIREWADAGVIKVREDILFVSTSASGAPSPGTRTGNPIEAQKRFPYAFRMAQKKAPSGSAGC